MPSPITVFIVTITIDPSNIDEYVRVLKPAYDAVIAEPEHVFFHVLRDQQAEGVLKFVEGWTESIERLMTVRFAPPFPTSVMSGTELKKAGGGVRFNRSNSRSRITNLT